MRAFLAAMLLTAMPASAWTLFPGMPQAVSVVLHAVGGYAIAAVADRQGAEPEAGIVLPAAVGLAKELSDLNFSPADFIAWPIGGWLYREGKARGWCWQHQPAVLEEWPHVFHLSECQK
jgi:hypothetical protein